MAADLSRARRKAADTLARSVERELDELRMSRARFKVAFNWEEDPDGVPVEMDDGTRRLLVIDSTGVDRVEFLISANPGEDPRPLARIASGGELARIALGLKSILSRADRRPTLVFDEVDVGVGARLGAVVGRKLWAISRSHQVLCVTHLPQVAAFADMHLGIAKEVEDGHTAVRATNVQADARVDELAVMLAGPGLSPAARESARELLKESDEAKARR
jgi:DNA repair protein RecN (Recombination protein N)